MNSKKILDWYKGVGERIREKRKNKGWSQKQLAEKVGMSRASIANIEGGRQQILAHSLSLFVEVFQTTPETLLLLSIKDAPKSTPKHLFSAKDRKWLRSILGEFYEV